MNEYIFHTRDFDRLVDYCERIDGNCNICDCRSVCRTVYTCDKARYWRENGLLEMLKEN